MDTNQFSNDITATATEPVVAPSEVAVAPSEIAVAPSEVAVVLSEVAVAPAEVAVVPSEVAVALQSYNLMLSTNIIYKILLELKPLKIERVSDSQMKSRIFNLEQSLNYYSQNFINSFNKYLSNAETFTNVVLVVVNNIKSLIDGNRTLTLTDIANFTTLIHNIYCEIDILNKGINVSLSSSDLIHICYIIIETVLSLVIIDNNDYDNILLILSSSVKMLSFTMGKTFNFNFSLFGCCKKTK